MYSNHNTGSEKEFHRGFYLGGGGGRVGGGEYKILKTSASWGVGQYGHLDKGWRGGSWEHGGVLRFQIPVKCLFTNEVKSKHSTKSNDFAEIE